MESCGGGNDYSNRYISLSV